MKDSPSTKIKGEVARGTPVHCVQEAIRIHVITCSYAEVTRVSEILEEDTRRESLSNERRLRLTFDGYYLCAEYEDLNTAKEYLARLRRAIKNLTVITDQ